MMSITSRTRTRDGSCLRVILCYTIRLFSSVELACEQLCVSVWCESGALFQMSHLKLHTSHFTLHFSHATLHTWHLHFTLHTSSHLIWALLTSSHLISSRMSSKCFSTIFNSSEHCSAFLISPKLFFLTHLSSCARRKAFTVREKSLAHKSRCAQKAFAHRSFCTQMHLHREAFTQISFYTEKLLHTEAFTQRNFYTQQAFTQRKLLHRMLLHMASVYTQQSFTLRTFFTQQAFTHRSFYT